MRFHLLLVITIGCERIEWATGNAWSAGWDGTHGGVDAAARARICACRIIKRHHHGGIDPGEQDSSWTGPANQK